VERSLHDVTAQTCALGTTVLQNSLKHGLGNDPHLHHALGRALCAVAESKQVLRAHPAKASALSIRYL